MAPRVRLSAFGGSWVLLSLALAAGAVAAQWLPAEALQWQRTAAGAAADGAVSQPWPPWRWFTAAFVHFGPVHLAANLAGCAVVAAYGAAAGAGMRWARGWTLAWAAAWPLTHAALVLAPGLERYGGLSGVLHAGVAVASVALVTAHRGWPRAIGAAVLAGTVLKVAAERPWAGAVQTVPGWDFPVAVAAHASGVVCGVVTGVLCALVCAALRWRGGCAAQGAGNR